VPSSSFLGSLASAYGETDLAPAKIPVKLAPFGVSVSAPARRPRGPPFKVPLVVNKNRMPVARRRARSFM